MDSNLKQEFDNRVKPFTHFAQLVAWDECHKIYLAMDETEAAFFRAEYPAVVEGTAEEMYAAVIKWYDNSCFLKFVNAVKHDKVDPDAGFRTLIPQGFLEEFDDDEEEDDECSCEIAWTGMDPDCPVC